MLETTINMMHDKISADAGSDGDGSIVRARRVDPSVIGIANTMRGSGDKSTSSLASAESGGGHRVSVDPGKASIVSAMDAKALRDMCDVSGTTENPSIEISSIVSALVAKALRDKRNTKGTGCGVRPCSGKSTAPVPSGTDRALDSGVEM